MTGPSHESWLTRRQEDHDRPEPDTRSFDCVLLRHDACDTTVWDPDTEGTADCGCDCHDPVNPDCRDGKHLACSGDAWDDDTDALTACACRCHDGEKADR